MPGLIVFRRRWDIGSDDLLFPAIFEIGLRFLWLLGIVIVFNTHRYSFDCSHGLLVHTYYVGIMALLSCHIVTNIVIAAVSMRGTIMDPLPRRHMWLLLWIKLFLYLPELVWTILGTYWAFDESSNCQSYVAITVKVASCIGWLAISTLVVSILVVFDPTGGLVMEHKRSAAVKLWETRFRVICCCTVCDKKHSAAFKDISKLLATFFLDVDLVVTDIAAGLLLVHVKQKHDEDETSYKYVRLGANNAYYPPIRHIPDPTGEAQLGYPQLEAIPELHVLSDQVIATSSESDCVITSQPGADNAATSRTRWDNGNSLSNSPPVPVVNAQHEAASQRMPKHSLSDQNSAQASPNRHHTQSNSDVRTEISFNTTPSHCLQHPRVQAPRDRPLVIKDWMSLENASYFIDYAIAIYTWPIFLYRNVCCGVCKLCTQITCCHRASRYHTSIVIDDNCCECHTSALLRTNQQNNLQRRDIIYANFNNKIYESPFYVCFDHQTKSVVVAIRGTLSLRDILTDLTAQWTHCHIDGMGEQYVHKGILRTAKYIETTLVDMDLLKNAFQSHPDYKLVVTGHSLGAGVAAMLSILLRPKFRSVQCFSYSPPGWLLSLPLARYTEDFVLSVVVGADLVPRIGIRTMEILKRNILQSIRDEAKPKYHIIAGNCWSAVCGVKSPDRQRLVPDQARHKSYSRVQPDPQEHTFREDVDEAIYESAKVSGSAEDLYMPGVVLYLQEEGQADICTRLFCGTQDYFAVYASQHQFQEILVTPSMLSNHLPDFICRVLKQCVEQGIQADRVRVEANRGRES